MLATTIHAQDFRDEDGDRAVGRRTIPLVFPRIARYTMLVMLPAWSLALATMWKLGDLTAPFVLVAVFIGGRFVIVRTVCDDDMSYTWYNVSRVRLIRDVALTVPLYRSGCPLFTFFRHITGTIRRPIEV